MALPVLRDRGLVALGIPTEVDPRGHRRVSVAELVGDAGDGHSGLVKQRGNGLWVADATRIPCGEGVFWLAAVHNACLLRLPSVLQAAQPVVLGDSSAWRTSRSNSNPLSSKR